MSGPRRRAPACDGNGLNLYAEGVIRVEFTIEPFVEGHPGPHVLAAVDAVEKHGITVEFGPFASEFAADDVAALAAVASLTSAAYANGATHVNIHLEKVSA